MISFAAPFVLTNLVFELVSITVLVSHFILELSVSVFGVMSFSEFFDKMFVFLKKYKAAGFKTAPPEVQTAMVIMIVNMVLVGIVTFFYSIVRAIKALRGKV